MLESHGKIVVLIASLQTPMACMVLESQCKQAVLGFWFYCLNKDCLAKNYGMAGITAISAPCIYFRSIARD